MDKQSEHNFKYGKYLSISLIVFAVSCVFVVGTYHMNYNKLLDARKENVRLTGNFISTEFRQRIVSNIQALQNLKGRIEETNGAYFDYWEYDANLIRSQSPSFKFVEWIDSNMVIQRINPTEGNENAIGLDISTLEYRAPEWVQAAKDSTLNFTHWLELVQGDYAFLVDAPVYYNGTFQGTITAGMDFTPLFDEIVSGTENYCITVSDQFGTPFYTYGNTANLSDYDQHLFRSEFMLFEEDKYWTFRLQPNAPLIEESAFSRLSFELYLGLMLSFLLGIAVFFIQISRGAADRLRNLNEQQRKLNHELLEEKQRAEAASNAKTEFLSNMSHEIRTPLSAIMGIIEILRFHEMSEDNRRYINLLELSSKNLLSLVNDILDLDKIESGRMELVQIEFSPRDEIRSLVEIHRPNFKESGLYLILEDAELTDEMVIGDPGKFAQVLNNLIKNAQKFTDKGGLEIVAYSKKVNRHIQVYLSFTDTGVGISKNKQEMIFERFTQLDSGLKKEYQGTGLGLSITQRIVQLMGGTISLESEEGNGACFSVQVSFPVLREPGKPESVEESSSDIDFSAYSALIVDDTQLNQIVLNKVLERYQINVDMAGNGQEALDKIAEYNYDIIFMDIHMPKKDGFETMEELKKMGINVPVIAVTANVTQEAMDKASSLGMQEYITKPYSSWRIYSVLKNYLKKTPV